MGVLRLCVGVGQKAIHEERREAAGRQSHFREVFKQFSDIFRRDYLGSKAHAAGLYVMLSFIFLIMCLVAALARFSGASSLPPQRIVSLGPAVTEKLYLLGLEKNIAGVTVYCQRPKAALEKPKIGTVTGINVEKVAALKPDLVIATSLTDPRSVKKLKNLGIKVAVFEEPESFDEMNGQFIEMGRLTGKEREATKIARTSLDKVKRMRAAAKELTRPKVFLQIGANPLFAAAKESLLNDFIEFSDGVNIIQDGKGGLLSRERVLAVNPDVILIVAMEGAVAESEKVRWQRFGTMKAVRDGAVYVMDPYKMCSPTPVTFVEALETVAGLLHPGRRERDRQ
ncbi:MAG: ABC transporter substrate-binding protein [Syntrophobacterales bacterium]|jgi:iron complex transport system substrate-binding protein|nr:ABC transporter substrate-binding protein [Syntrophobacterales bacterium]